MQNLSRDSVVSNAMSADTDFHVNYRRVELEAPFLIVCATDGCFGYLQTPMHFEHLLLDELTRTRSANAWSEALQQRIAAVTGDDAAMSVIGVRAHFRTFQTLLAPRLAELATTVVQPLDALAQAVAQAEDDLQSTRTRQLDTTSEVWGRYKTEYERYLRDQPPAAADKGDPGVDVVEPVEPADASNGPSRPPLVLVPADERSRACSATASTATSACPATRSRRGWPGLSPPAVTS